MFKTVKIHAHQLGLRFRDGDFAGLLRPGRHVVRSPVLGRFGDRVQLVSTLASRFQHELLDVLVQHAEFRSAFLVVDLSDTERAVLRKDGRVAEVLGPGRHVFPKGPCALEVDRYDIEQVRFEHAQMDAVLALPSAALFLREFPVPTGYELLVFRDAELFARVSHGRAVLFKGVGRVERELVDLREQTLDVAGQEIMTRDKVTLRVNLIVTFVVTDTVLSVTVVDDASQALYRQAQLALRAAVGERSLDALLQDKESMGSELQKALVGPAEAFGVAVRAVGLKDVILPGDMKLILNQVITAQKQAEANLILRREETAAARSQANTAKLLADNPVLARLKELELLKETLAGTDATFVFGGSDLTTQLQGLVAAQKSG